jgi:hypothetical protein
MSNSTVNVIYSEIHRNAKMEFDVFLIIFQFTTFKHHEKPKTILKLSALPSIRLNCKLLIKKLLMPKNT